MNDQMKEKIAAFDVDAQKTFGLAILNELYVSGGEGIVSELNAQAEFAQYRVASKDAHPPKPLWLAADVSEQFQPVEGDHPNLDVKWGRHGVVGSEGFELLDGLPQPAAYDFMVYKGVEPDMHPYGACYHDLKDQISTGVIEWLKVKGVEIVIVGGLATDYCVKLTVLQLLAAGFRVIVNLGACRGIAPESVAAATKEMASAGAEFVRSSKDLREM